MAAPYTETVAGLAALAALILLARMRRWHSLATLKQPILWILHLGYLWLPAGLALEATAVFAGWPAPFAAMHGLTAGAIGVMVLAVASRAGLGHSGRPLKVGPAITLAYVLILAAAAAVLTTVSLIGKGQTEASDNSGQLGSESTPYQINATSRPILVENITFQTKSSGNTVMVSLQLIVEQIVHKQWGTLSPEIQSILKTEVKNQTMEQLSKATAENLKDYSERDGYAEKIQKAVNDKVFNPFVKKGPKEAKDAAKYFKPAEEPIVKKVIFYELIVVDN